jgi:hypothetical protein
LIQSENWIPMYIIISGVPRDYGISVSKRDLTKIIKAEFTLKIALTFICGNPNQSIYPSIHPSIHFLNIFYKMVCEIAINITWIPRRSVSFEG